jgi:hypothetical protein
MSKRALVERSWDKRKKRDNPYRDRPPADSNNSNSTSTSNDGSSGASSTAVPYVTIDGHRYYSDRFYLNVSALDNDKKNVPTATSAQESTAAADSKCNCGRANNRPPPLLDRSRLVESLSLKAAILATYTVEPDAVMNEFPCLFGPAATVPTLVLHGQKKWTAYRKSEIKKRNAPGEQDYDYESNGEWDEEGSFQPNPSTVDDCSLGTQEEATVRAADQFGSPAAEKSRATFDGMHNNGSNRNGSEAAQGLPDHVHWTEVTTTWIRPEDRPAVATRKDGTVTEAVVNKRQYKMGVHHPKFFILFETSGSVVVLVSTSNLTRSVSTDASWVQRFPAAKPDSSSSAVAASEKPPKADAVSTAAVFDGSDVGAVLANLLQCQTWASQVGQLTPRGFCRKYLQWKNLNSLERNFDFQQSQVHLVVTVPGEHEGRLSTTASQQKQQPSFLYGRQRVAHVVSQLSQLTRAWLPKVILNDTDRLVFQPTSLGGEWNISNMSQVVRSYLGLDDDNANRKQHPNQSLLDRLDIVWPTLDWMNALKNALCGRRSPNSVAVIENGISSKGNVDEEDSRQPRAVETSSASFLFLSSVTFNSIDENCLSRMVMFKPSEPTQRKTLIPHFKSVARVCKGSEHRLRKENCLKDSDECFSWFLLTSACLSRGAQGEATPDKKRPPGCNAVSYSNFELGVLFCSRLQGETKTDRLYCWKPAHCACAKQAARPSLIHLPVPYSFRALPYQDKDDVYFCETPYLHEIPPGTGSDGKMLYTPYGAALARQQEHHA